MRMKKTSPYHCVNWLNSEPLLPIIPLPCLPPLPSVTLFTSGATGGGAREDGGGFLACDWPVLQHRFTGCLPWPVAVQRVAGLAQSVPGNDGNTAASQQAAACELAVFVVVVFVADPHPLTSNPHNSFCLFVFVLFCSWLSPSNL